MSTTCARRTSSFCKPTFSRRLPMVPVLSSAAKIPLPGAHKPAAVDVRSDGAMLVMARVRCTAPTSGTKTPTITHTSQNDISCARRSFCGSRTHVACKFLTLGTQHQCRGFCALVFYATVMRFLQHSLKLLHGSSAYAQYVDAAAVHPVLDLF